MVTSLGRAVKAVPFVRSWQEQSYERMFATSDCYGGFRGVFRTFAEATRSAPPTTKIGFDHPAVANEFSSRHDRVFSYDYPVLFWLKSIVKPGTKIFDYGGHVGVQFYGYEKYLTYPTGFQWRVCDVPAVTAAGRELAASRGRKELSFTNSPADADGFDVLIAAGALQYVESPLLAESISRLRDKPAHLLLNKLPLTDGEPFVTLQNAGPSFVPQYVFSRSAFIRSLTDVGYELVDSWEDCVHSCRIPFHSDRDVPRYSGLYLRRRA